MTSRVLRWLASEGRDPRALCEAASLSYDVLGDPSARVAYRAVDTLIEIAASVRGREGLAVALADVVDDETYGAAGLALATAPSFGEGLARAFAYQRLWGDGDRFALRATHEGLCASFRHPGASEIARAVLEPLAMIEIVSSARLLVGPHVAPRAVRLALPPSEDEALVARLGVVPTFGALATEVVLDASVADAPICMPRVAIDRVVAREAQRAIARLPAARSTVARVRAAVSEAGLGASLFAAAERLRMSARTLQRRLHDEGTSYAMLVDGLRRERVARLDARGAPEKEIAIAVGFADPSALARARTRWRRVDA